MESQLLGSTKASEEALCDFDAPEPHSDARRSVRVDCPTWSRGPLRICRQTAHIFIAIVMLLFLFPLMAAIALGVMITSRGPVLFKQRRVGEGGREFWVYKFRSMVVDAEARRIHLSTLNEASGPLFKIRNDPRVTPIGRVLRKLSLDELPQLLNVVKGDMCLIGPRPALPAEVAQYTPRQQARLAAPPGITGLAQVSGRSDLSFEKCIELDLYFINHWSPLLDIRIFLRTISVVLSGRGAY
ncbi:MAG: sugar transferase [Capsulimonas sp.]|nr:sugar transferase [Capsulimonas sp.]